MGAAVSRNAWRVRKTECALGKCGCLPAFLPPLLLASPFLPFLPSTDIYQDCHVPATVSAGEDAMAFLIPSRLSNYFRHINIQSSCSSGSQMLVSIRPTWRTSWNTDCWVPPRVSFSGSLRQGDSWEFSFLTCSLVPLPCCWWSRDQRRQ